MSTAKSAIDPGARAARPGSLEDWAARCPDEVAAVEGDRVWTWSAWNEAADRLAEGLSKRGIGPGAIVAVRTQIRLEWLVISAALAKLDCRLLGLNWRLTPTEVAYCLSSSGATAIIADDVRPELLLPAVADLDLAIAVSLDAPAAGFVDYVDLLEAAPVPRLSSQEAPMVLFTSGTTGLPKCVMKLPPTDAAEIQVMLEYAADLRQSDPIDDKDVVLVTMPFSHGAGPAVVRGSLAAGAKMVFLRRFDPDAALELIARHKVTKWATVPTMLKRLAAVPVDVLTRHDVSSIRRLGTGAAPVPYSLKQWVIAHFGPVLHEGYGATEVGMISHLTPKMQETKPGSSGAPHRHVAISIRDDAGSILTTGQTGEIWVRTPATITTYYNAPPLDATTLDADGFFRTGDVGYLDEDGYIFITDRAKDMIISGGVNIYPAEIEAVLHRHPAIQDVAVIGIPDEEFGESVKAFVELKPGCSLEAAELMHFAQAEGLASYKRPKDVAVVEELPRNTMGKILKKDLRAPYWVGRDRSV